MPKIVFICIVAHCMDSFFTDRDRQSYSEFMCKIENPKKKASGILGMLGFFIFPLGYFGL